MSRVCKKKMENMIGGGGGSRGRASMDLGCVPGGREEVPDNGNALSAFALYSLSERRELAPPTVLFAFIPSSSSSSSSTAIASRSKAIGAVRRDVT